MLKTLISRNLKLYFRDKAALFFSLLSVIIVIGLFVIFLAQIQIDSITETATNISKDKIAYLVHSWILGGLLSVTTVTSVLGGYGSMVGDKEKKIIMGFKSAPIKAWVYPFVNVISSFIIGVVISTVSLTIYTACIYFISGYILTMKIILLAFMTILFSSLINSFILGCLCSFMKTISAFSALSILIGTIIGFINGLYVPLGSLNQIIVSTLSIFPSLHMATLFREITTSVAINEVFANVPKHVLQDYSLKYGIILKFGNMKINVPVSLIYVATVGIIGLVLMIINIRRKTKEA